MRRTRFSRRTFLTGTGALAAAVAAGGCRLQREAVRPRTFVLPWAGGEGSESAAQGGGVGILAVRPLRVTPECDARAFLVRRGEAEFEADPYHAFLLSPGPMLTEILARWVRTTGVFGQVTTGGSTLTPTHALEGEVTELWGDYREAGRPRAVVGLRVRLVDVAPGGGPARVLWERAERREAVLPRAGAEELVAGWEQAWGAILDALAPVVRGTRVSASRAPGSGGRVENETPRA